MWHTGGKTGDLPRVNSKWIPVARLTGQQRRKARPRRSLWGRLPCARASAWTTEPARLGPDPPSAPGHQPAPLSGRRPVLANPCPFGVELQLRSTEGPQPSLLLTSLLQLPCIRGPEDRWADPEPVGSGDPPWVGPELTLPCDGGSSPRTAHCQGPEGLSRS